MKINACSGITNKWKAAHTKCTGNWNQPMDKVRRPVDDGTSAWGAPDNYHKVNLWDKTSGGPPPATSESAPTSTQNLNNDSAAKGWGSTPTNQPSSPKGWPDISPTRSNKVDTGVSAWGAKPLPSNDNNVNKSNWNAKGNTPNNWSQTSKAGSGWGQETSSQWGQGDSGWNQQFGKVVYFIRFCKESVYRRKRLLYF